MQRSRWRRSSEAGQREEDEAEGVGGKEKGNDPSVLFIKKGICQARESRSREFGNKAAALIVAGFITSDVTPVYREQRR